jgi:hypothetical protein
VSDEMINPCVTFDKDKKTGKAFNIRIVDTDTEKELIVIRDGNDCTKEFIECLVSGKVFANTTFRFKDIEQGGHL